jgi:hypothetical protein
MHQLAAVCCTAALQVETQHSRGISSWMSKVIVQQCATYLVQQAALQQS